jgi:hypothetical protein
MSSTKKLILDNYFNELSQAEYLRFDLNKQKLVETNIGRVFFEKIKGFLGFTDTTNVNLLADKILIYLDKRHELLIKDNLERIQHLCRLAGIIQIKEYPQKLTLSQKKLIDLVNHILLTIEESKEQNSCFSERLSELSVINTEDLINIDMIENEVIPTLLPQFTQKEDENSQKEQNLENEPNAFTGNPTKEEKNTANEETTSQEIEKNEENIDIENKKLGKDDLNLEKKLTPKRIDLTEKVEPQESTLKKILKVAIPVFGFAFAGFSFLYHRNSEIDLSNVQKISLDTASFHIFNPIDFAKQFISKPPVSDSFSSSVAASSFESFLNNPPFDVDEKILLHAVGDLFGDPTLEGSFSLKMIDYFLGVIKAKIDSMKICEGNVQDEFCRQYAGTSYKELEGKLKLATEIYDHFRKMQTHEFSNYLQDKISALKPQESLFFPGGWTKHAIVYELIKQTDDKITFRAYNTGEGSEIHSNALIGLEKVYLPFVERVNININHFFGPIIIASLQELVKSQSEIENSLESYDFTNRVLQIIGGDINDKVYDEKVLLANQKSGTCSYMSLIAAFTQNFKERKALERFIFEAEIKALNDYDRNYSHRYSESKQAYNLMQKGKATFAVRALQWAKKGVINKEEFTILLNTIKRIEKNLEAANQFTEQRMIKNYPKLSLTPKLNATEHTILDFPSVSENQDDNFDINELHGYITTIRNINEWQVNPKNLISDLKNIQNDIKNIKKNDFQLAQELIKQVALKLSFEDPEFWNHFDKTQAPELVKMYSKLGEDLFHSIFIDAIKIEKGYLKPSDYLAMLKFLRGADETLQKCQKELGFSFPSVHQNVMNTFFDNLAVTFPLTEVEWHEEFNRLRIYWKEQKERKTAYFAGQISDFFGLDRDHGEGNDNELEMPLSERKYIENGLRIAELDWAIAWLRHHPDILKKLQTEIESSLQEDDSDLKTQKIPINLKDIIITAATTIRTLNIGKGSTSYKIEEKFVLPTEFYDLRKLAIHSSHMILGTMNPCEYYFKDKYLTSSTSIHYIKDVFIWKNGYGEVIYPRIGFIPYNNPKRPYEWNFKESIGQISHSGVTSFLFDDKTLNTNSFIISTCPYRSDAEVTFSTRKRLTPNQIILSEITHEKEFERALLGLSSQVELQIDETLGFFTAHIGHLANQDYQDTFEYLIFDAGLLLREMKVPKDSQLLTIRLSDFCERGFYIFLKRQDLRTAYFFLKMNRRIHSLVNQHFKEYPNHFPIGFKSPFLDAKLWISQIYSQKGLNQSLKADLARDKLSIYGLQATFDKNEWVDFISTAIELNTIAPHPQKEEMTLHFEAKESLLHRFFDLKTLENDPKKDWIFNEVVKRILHKDLKINWVIQYPYAKGTINTHEENEDFYERTADYVVDLKNGKIYERHIGRHTRLPEFISQDPSFIRRFGQKDHWDAQEISQNFYEFSNDKGFSYRVTKTLNNDLDFQYKFQGNWYKEFTSDNINYLGTEAWNSKKNLYLFTTKGVPQFLIEKSFSFPFKIEELNEKGEKTGRVIANFDNNDDLRKLLERFEDNDHTTVLLDKQTGQPLAVKFERYELTFSAKKNLDNNEWELFSDQYPEFKVSKTQGLSALSDHSNYFLLEKDVQGKKEHKVLLPLVTFESKGSTLAIKDIRKNGFKNIFKSYFVDIDPKTGKLNPKEDLARLHLAMRYLWKQEYAEANYFLSDFITHDHSFSQAEIEMLESIANLNNNDKHPHAQALRYRAEALLLRNQAYFSDHGLKYMEKELDVKFIRLQAYLENLEYMGNFRLTPEEEILIYNDVKEADSPLIQHFRQVLAPHSFGIIDASNPLKSSLKQFISLKIPGLDINYWVEDFLKVEKKANSGSILKDSLTHNFVETYEVLQEDLITAEKLRNILIKITGLQTEIELLKTGNELLDKEKLLKMFEQILLVKMRDKNKVESRSALILSIVKQFPNNFPSSQLLKKANWKSEELKSILHQITAEANYIFYEPSSYLKKLECIFNQIKGSPNPFQYQQLHRKMAYHFTSREIEIVPTKEIPGICMILPENNPFGSKPVIPQLEDYFEKKITIINDAGVQLCEDLQKNIFSKKIDDSFVQAKFNKINEKLKVQAEKNKKIEKIQYLLRGVQKLHSLKIRLQEEIIQRNTELFILQQQIESLINRPYESSEQELKELKFSGGIDSPINLNEALHIFLQQDSHRYQQRNPALSTFEAANANKLIGGFLERATYCNQINKVVEKINQTLELKLQNAAEDLLQNSVDELIQLSSQHRMYSTAQHPEYLLFEYQNGILYKKEQVDLLDKLKINNGRIGAPQYLGVVGEAIPGMGKTFAVLPTLSLLNADGENISINMIPESLIESMNPKLRNTLKTTSGNLLERIDIDRSTSVEEEDLKMLFARLNRIRDERRVLSLKPSSAYSLYLRFIEQFEQKLVNSEISDKEKALSPIKIFSDILTFFKSSGSLIIDEIDTVQDITQSSHFTTGVKQPLEEIYRNTTSSTFLYLATNKEIGEKVALGFGLYQGKEGLTENRYHKEIKPLIIDALLSNKLSDKDPEFNTFLLKLNLSEKTILANFLNGKEILKGRKLLIEKASENIQDRFGIYFEHFNELLPLTLSKKLNEHYGRDPTDSDSQVAIPYRNSNPSIGSTHGTELEMAFYTVQMQLQRGIDAKIVEKELDRIRLLILKYLQNHSDKSPQDAPNYKEYLLLTGGNDIANIFKPSKQDIKTVTDLINKDPKLQILLIDRYILPEISVYPTQLNANSPIMGMLFRSIQGMTGTLWNVESLTRLIEQVHGSSTTEEILQLIWRDKGPITEITLPTTIGKEGIRKILNQFYFRKDFKPGSFIDTAALFRDVADRADVAKEMLLLDCWKDTSIKGVIFYDSQNKLKVMKHVDGIPAAVDLESSGLSREEMVVFWDQQHTTGSDLKVAEDGTATMSIGKDTILRDWEQSALRLRELAKKQRLNFVVSDQDARVIQANLKDSTGENIEKLELKHLLFHAIYAQSERQAKENFSGLKQKMDIILLEKFYSILIDPKISFEDKISVYKATRPLFADTTRARAFDLFAQPVDKKDKELVLQMLKEKFMQSTAMTAFKTHPFLKSRFKESKITEELEALIAIEKANLADKFSVNTNTYGKERVIQVEKQKETEKEVEKQKETFKIKQINQNLYVLPFEWPKENFFTHAYFNNIVDPVSKILNEGMIPAAHLIDSQLQGTKNLFPKTEHLELNDRFGFYQKKHNFILATQDKMTKQWRVILLDQNDAVQFKQLLNQDALNPNLQEKREILSCLYHLDAKTQHSSSEVIPYDMFEKSPELVNLIVQAKFLSGESSYDKNELPLLKAWLEKDPKELFNLFNHVIKFKEESRKKFIDSDFEHLFNSLL